MTTPRTAALNVLTIAILGSAAGCSDAMGPSEGPEPPQARFETVTDVTLTPRYLKVSWNEACDGSTAITNKPRNGEFQYRVESYRNGAQLESLQSSGYGKVSGAATSAGPGETIQFRNQTWRFDNLRNGDQVELRLRATEWDLTSRDDDLDDLDISRYFNIPLTPQDSKDISLMVGVSTCGLLLYYDLSVTTRDVRVD